MSLYSPEMRPHSDWFWVTEDVCWAILYHFSLIVGIIMTWSLLLGLLLGAVVAYALTPLTNIQELVLCTNSTTTQYFNLCGHENDTNILP